MASNADIFGDEDSSEDEDMNTAKESETLGVTEQGGEEEMKDVDDDDKKGDDDDSKKAEKKKEEPEKKRPSIFDDDSDDEDDAVFDGNDEVTGSKLDPEQQRAKQEQEERRRQSQEAPKKKKKKIDARTTVLLESELPPSDVSLHITKLPNLIGLQPEAFDPDTYSAKEEEEHYSGNVHNMLRWRYAKDGNGEMKRDDDGKLMRESNARVVQWEDGSMTLHIGHEAFEIDMLDSSKNKNGFAGINGYLYLSQTATLKSPQGDEEETQTLLECMGPMSSRLTVRPASLRSEAHKSLTVAVRQKTIKSSRIAEYVTQEDPEMAKQEKIKMKSDLARAEARKRQGSNYYQNYKSPVRRMPGMNRRYLEEDEEDYDTININSMKRGLNADDEMDDYGDESDDDDDDDGVEEEEPTFNNRKRRNNKRSAAKNALADDSDSDDDDDAVFGKGDGDSDEEIAPTKGSNKKRAHKALMDDDDDD